MASSSLEKLQTELKSLFQLDKKELDFGIYKIYWVLNEKLNNWIDKQLPKKVENALDKINKDNLKDTKNQLEKEITQINSILENLGKNLEKDLVNLDEIYNSLCTPSNDNKICKTLENIKKLSKDLEANKENVNLETTVYDYIIKFYDSIYQDGDYIIPRKKIIWNDINENDVEFDWKTKGQILIKNMDIQTYFSFDTKTWKKIEFKVIDIIDYWNNNKNNWRFLIPINIKLEDEKLIAEFVLWKFDEQSLNHEIEWEKISKKVENLIKIIDDENLSVSNNKITYSKYNFWEKEFSLTWKEDKIWTLHLIKLFLDKKKENKLKKELFNYEDNWILNEKSKLLDFKIDENTNSLLAKNLRKWYRMWTSDFFLNPNLAKELEEYKNEFIKDKMLYYLLEATKWDNNKANVLKAFEEVVNEINSFVSTIENIQVQLFNRKKYIYETHYVITFDRLKIFSLKEDLSDLKEFLANFIWDKFQDLQNEYIKLWMIKKEDKKDNLNNFIDFVLENDKLYLDTKIFVNKDWKEYFEVYSKTFDLLVFISKFIDFVNENKWENEIIDEKLSQLNIDLDKWEKLDLDKLLNWELYKWDNYHALNLLQNKYYEAIKTIYIDPPYNTWNDGFLYKDNMKHSTWLTMMESRLKLARELMKEDWVIFSSIWRQEQERLQMLFNELLPYKKDEDKLQISWQTAFWWGQSNKNNYENILVYTKLWRFTFDWVKNQERQIRIIHWWKEDINSDISFSIRLNYSLIKNKLYLIVKDKINNKKIKVYFYNKNQFVSDLEKLWLNKTKDFNKIIDCFVDYNERIKWEKIWRKFWEWKYYIYRWLDEWYLYETVIWKKVNSILNKDDKLFSNILHWDKYKNIYSSIWRDELIKIIWDNNFDTVKPEELLYQLLWLNISNWMILDYFAWSWTTCAVAQKMWRKWIWCEVNNYFDEIIIPRLKKVLNWEQGWISKQEDWQGWWFFRYSYLENYEDTLENFVLKLEETLHNEELQKNDLENNLYNLALAIWIAFEESKIETSFKNFQLKDKKTYPSYKLASKRNDIHTFIEEEFDKKALKTFVDLVHYYPLSKDWKHSLKSVKQENWEFIFEYSDEKWNIENKTLKEIDVD